MLFPFIIMLLTSLKTMSEIQSPEFHLFPKTPHFENYARAMMTGNWVMFLRNSLFITAVTVVCALLFNSSAGYAFARLSFPGRDAIFFILLMGIMVPPQTSMVPAFLILKRLPLAGGNDILGRGGTGLINTFGGLIVPFVSGSIGIFLCRQFYINFPGSLDDAAEIDGASRLQTYARIYIPLSKPIIAALAITKATATWNDYIWPLLLTNDEEHMTVQLALAIFRSQYSVQWDLLMAATAVVVLPLIVLFFLFQKYFVQGIVTTGFK